MPLGSELSQIARRLGSVLEPVIGQVYFSPECHANYVALGFDPSPGFAGGVALPDGPAYFTSRGSVMGQVAGDVIAAAFAVFNPAVVVPLVEIGWGRTDAPTICQARTDGAVAQLRRILGDDPAGVDRAVELLRTRDRAVATGGTPAVRGGAFARRSRRAARRDVASGRSTSRVPRRLAHDGVGRGRVRRHRDRSAHRALLGAPDAHLRPHEGVERGRVRRRDRPASFPRPDRRRRVHRRRARRPRGDRGGDRRADAAGPRRARRRRRGVVLDPRTVGGRGPRRRRLSRQRAARSGRTADDHHRSRRRSRSTPSRRRPDGTRSRRACAAARSACRHRAPAATTARSTSRSPPSGSECHSSTMPTPASGRSVPARPAAVCSAPPIAPDPDADRPLTVNRSACRRCTAARCCWSPGRVIEAAARACPGGRRSTPNSNHEA